ncbi:glycosyltransferase family 9 protein [Alphaproteobacteria bacterium]|nr:glycosyltransferase family 9 protein [Alphaproteobacteria bacterium]
MNVLFITSSRIGDAVLSTGLLDYISQTHPNAKVTIVCGPLCTSLFEGYPNRFEIIPLKKKKGNKHWFELGKRVWPTRWDMVVDLRNSIVSRVIRAKQRYIFGRGIDKSMHKVQQAAAVMKLADVPAPKLWFTEAQKVRAQHLIADGSPVIGVGPTANWIGKTWPAERFNAILDWVLTEKMPDARVAVFAAPGEEEAALQVLASIPDDRRIDIIAKTSPGEAAACLARCSLYIGNDSGLMHCAAAAGVSTFGLFGPSYPHLYGPWGDHGDYARTPESFDELIDYEGYTPQSAPCLMESLSVEAVKDKLSVFLESRKAA